MKKLVEFARDLLGLTGAALLIRGLFLAWPPLGWIAAGATLIALALLLRQEK